jgi:5-methylcytosine-specific restriction protein B
VRASPIKIISVNALDGIKPDFQEILFEAMKNCTNGERMLVCLYFMSDLPEEQHHLDEIEQNLRKIFPPSLSEGMEPDNYKNFHASVVRGTFSHETQRVKDRQSSPAKRFWRQSRRGYWYNTELGNKQAIEVLYREGIEVRIIDDQEEIEEGIERTQATQDNILLNPPFPLSQLAEDTGLGEAELVRWVRAIERKGQAILYGPPGTGKTFVAEKLAAHLIGGGDGFVELVQFHPAYAYEDFIQGIRPQSDDDHLSYPLVPGRFLEFCYKAQPCRDICVLIIDEINRANLSRVFGELMYLLEYRDRAVPLAGGGFLRIPANVRLIGTMNTADRSIALVDHALRRRFAFIALYPNYELLRRYHQHTGFPVEGLVGVLTGLNRTIGDRHYEVGVTFFLHPNLAGEIEDIWRMEIEPYLEEYFFDRPDTVEDFRWAKVRDRIL